MIFERGAQGYRVTSPKSARGSNFFDQGHKDTGIHAIILKDSIILIEEYRDTGSLLNHI